MGNAPSARVVQGLGLAIVSGRFAQGGPLPTEAALCAAYGVSRTALREALKTLGAKGLLVSRPRSGSRVRPSREWSLFDRDVLGWLEQSSADLVVLRELSALRAAIEPAAAAIGAVRREPSELEALRLAVEGMAAAAEGKGDPLACDVAFHLALLGTSGNRFFMHFGNLVSTALSMSIRVTNARKGVAAADVDAHAAIYEAIRDGAEEEAHRRAAALIDEARTLLESREACA